MPEGKITKTERAARAREARERIAALEAELAASKTLCQSLRENEARYRRLFEAGSDATILVDNATGRILLANAAATVLYGYSPEELLDLTILDLSAEVDETCRLIRENKQNAGGALNVPCRLHRKKDGSVFPVEITIRFLSHQGRPAHVAAIRDVTERRRMEEALEKRLVALTRPLNDADAVSFEDLFNLEDIQRLQNEFAEAVGVASIITHPDGRPITAPSNFCRLCNEIIRKTPKGLNNCYRSDASLGRLSMTGPTVRPCMSGGLWDAGAGISVGGRHVANWLIGQVRDAAQNEEAMRAYARDIDADEEVVVEAFREVPTMSRERFNAVAKVLFTLANQLSNIAYQNVQQARFIAERNQAEAALRESEERLKLALEAVNDGLWDWNLKTGEVFFSPGYYRMLGYEPGEFPSGYQAWRDLTHEDDLGEAERRLDAHFARGEPYEVELRLRTKQGGWKWILARGRTVSFDEFGKPARMAGTHVDITERKQTLEALERSESKFRRILEDIPLIGVALDSRGNIAFANDYFLRLTGWNREDLLGKDWFETFIPPEIEPDIRRVFRKTIREKTAGDYSTYENDILARDGRRLRVAWSNVLTRDKKGGILDVTCVGLDVTERKRAEEELRRSLREVSNAKALFNAVIEQSPIPMAVADATDSSLLVINPACRSLLLLDDSETATGLDVASLKRSWSFYDRTGRPLPLEELPLMRALRGEVFPETEARVVRRDGSERWAVLYGAPICNAEGERIAGFAAMPDVTERRRAEELLVQTEKMLSVGGLAAGMAHEINNPLGIILAAAQNALRRVDPEFPKNLEAADRLNLRMPLLRDYLEERGVFGFLENIKNGAERASRIVRNMLDFSRSSQSRKAPLDVRLLLDKALELAANDYDLKKRYDFRKIVVTRRYAPDVPLVA